MRVYSTDNGWGLFKDESGEARSQARKYRRTYTWNSRNQLVSSVDANYSTSYVYGQDGQRSNKYTQGSETLYFNKMWTLHTDNGNSVYGGQYAKNIYLGETRIVTKLARADQKTAHEEMYKQYYYHSDHLGSATMISDWEGKEYQRIEYTPYGETWVEKTNNSGSEFLPYRFTGKEVDQETGLYYYGARYLDPKYSMWISTDPALGEYIPEMGKGNAKDSGSLPGMGGVYNHINGNLYHYAGNNPVKYVDPDGCQVAVPLPPAIPWGLPKVGPIPYIPPVDFIPPIISPFKLVPGNDGHLYYKNWNGDWNNPPRPPNMNDPNDNPLGDDWEPDKDANEKDPTGEHRLFRNKRTDEHVRWDEGNDKQEGHWHRLNPKKEPTRQHKYLDRDGKPVHKDSPDGHFYPKKIPDINFMA